MDFGSKKRIEMKMWCDNSRICHDAIQLRATKNGYPTAAKQLTASAQEPKQIASAHTHIHAYTNKTTNVNSKFEEAFWQRRVEKRQPEENKLQPKANVSGRLVWRRG